MRTASRFHRLVVLCLLLATLIPLSAVPAAAQGEDCPEGLVYLEEEDLCVLPEEAPDDGAEDGTDDAEQEDSGDQSDDSDDGTDDAEQEDSDDQSDDSDEEDVEDLEQVDDAEDVDIEEEPGYIGEIYLQHFACDPGFDPVENVDNWEGLVGACIGSGKPAFTYNVYVDQELVATVGLQTSDDGWGEVSLPGAQEEPIPAGYVTIVVDEAPGYTTSWVNCVASLDDGSSRDLQPSIDGGNAASFGVEPGEYVVCEWFNVPIAEPGSGSAGTSFTITKYACEGDYLPDPLEDPYSYYSASCTETVAGQQFTLQQGEDGPTRSETGEDGTFFLQDIPVSEPYEPPVWTVSERIPAGYGEPVVFCGPAGETKQAMTLSNGNAITLAFANGVTDLACDWYNIPGESLPATISIQSWLCETVALAVEELAGECTQPATNTSYSLYSETSTLNSLATDDSGAVTFENVPPGNLAIVEDLPSGYGPVMVTCDHASTAFGQQQIAPNIQLGNGFTIEIDAGDTLDCDWYNLPALGSDNGPNIAIEGYQCPPTTAVTADSSLDEALAQCINPAFGTTYEILIGEELITSAFSGDSGQVFFTKLPTLEDGETYSLRMVPDEANEVLAAWCDVDNGDGDYLPIETPLQDGNRIEIELLEGANMRCTWFSKLGVITTPEPQGPGGGAGETGTAITVDARFCPPEIETQRGDYEDLCPYPGADVDFELSMNGELVGTATSDETGRVVFAGSEDGGTYLLRHVPNPGFSLPAITCVKTTDGVASEPFYDALIEDTGFAFELEAGETIACSWYILINPDLYVPKEDLVEEPATSGQPSEDTGISEVIVQFWICPADVDISSPQEDLLLACQVETEDRDLRVTIGGEPFDQSVPGYGTWNFGNSSFVLDIRNTDPTSAWCSSTWEVDGEEEVTFPEQMDVDAGVLSLTLEVEGTVTYCDWFVHETVANASAPDANVDLPGSGDTSSDLVNLPIPDTNIEFPASFEVSLGGTTLGHVLYDGDGWGEMIATPSQSGGTGSLRLTRPFVDGYGGMPRVFCTILAPGGATNLEPSMIDSASIEIQAPNNSLVVCEWFRPLKTIG